MSSPAPAPAAAPATQPAANHNHGADAHSANHSASHRGRGRGGRSRGYRNRGRGGRSDGATHDHQASSRGDAPSATAAAGATKPAENSPVERPVAKVFLRDAPRDVPVDEWERTLVAAGLPAPANVTYTPKGVFIKFPSALAPAAIARDVTVRGAPIRVKPVRSRTPPPASSAPAAASAPRPAPAAAAAAAGAPAPVSAAPAPAASSGRARPQHRRSGGRLQGLVVLVTGAAGAIGAAICQRALEEGARVSAADMDSAALERLLAALPPHLRGNIHTQVVNVVDEAQVKAWVDTVMKRWHKLDVLVNNAAAFVFGKIEETTSEMWDKVLSVNVKGYALCAKACLAHMKSGGSIINMASVSSVIAQPAFVPYNTSKGAILQLTRCLALDLGERNIRVNAICPGTIETPATRKHAEKLKMDYDVFVKTIITDHFVKRLGAPVDIAHAVIFLASTEESGFITGTTLTIDGGFTAH